MTCATGQEYLQITSCLLDDQLKEDAKIKKSTKVLRPSSAKRLGSAQRNSTIHQSSKRCTAIPSHALLVNGGNVQDDLSVTTPVGRNGTHQARPSSQSKTAPSSKISGLTNLSDILHMFSDADKMQKPVPLKDAGKIIHRSDGTESRKFNGKYDPQDLFSPDAVIGSRKARPVSATLQQRHDHIRSQTKKKARPQTAKPAFRHATDSEFISLIRTHHEEQSPVSSPENTKESLTILQVNSADKGTPPFISVNISANGAARNRHGNSTSTRTVFPPKRDSSDQPLGDVTDALQTVQEMERLFRFNTRRLQHRIGIPNLGCI